jgi:hypothetical protein
MIGAGCLVYNLPVIDACREIARLLNVQLHNVTSEGIPNPENVSVNKNLIRQDLGVPPEQLYHGQPSLRLPTRTIKSPPMSGKTEIISGDFQGRRLKEENDRLKALIKSRLHELDGLTGRRRLLLRLRIEIWAWTQFLKTPKLPNSGKGTPLKPP